MTIINELQEDLDALEEHWYRNYPGESWKKNEINYSEAENWSDQKRNHRDQMRQLEKEIIKVSKKYFETMYEKEPNKK